jgi:hypothetical protein
MTQMGQMTTSKPVITIIWACQEMMAWMSMELVGYFEVLSYDLGSEAWQITADFGQAPTTNLTQLDSNGPHD